MITVNVGQMLDSIPALKELVEAKISVVAGYQIARITAVINEELKSFVDAKNSMIEKFDLEDELEKAEAEAEMKKLLAVEIDLPFEQLKIESLGPEAVLKPKVLMALDFLFGD